VEYGPAHPPATTPPGHPYQPAPVLGPVATAPSPLTCPWCAAHGPPGSHVQTCSSCGRRFTLSAGPALDVSIVPPPPLPPAAAVYLKWSVVWTYKFAALEPLVLSSGTLDPVIGMASVDKTDIAYHDVLSIAVWRKIAWREALLGLLVPLPIALLLLYVTAMAVAKEPGLAWLGAPAALFGLLAAVLMRRGFMIGRRHARVLSRYGTTVTVPFDGSRPFHEQLFHRCGLVPPPIP
jgi:hypothetical protein